MMSKILGLSKAQVLSGCDLKGSEQRISTACNGRGCAPPLKPDAFGAP